MYDRCDFETLFHNLYVFFFLSPFLFFFYFFINACCFTQEYICIQVHKKNKNLYIYKHKIECTSQGSDLTHLGLCVFQCATWHSLPQYATPEHLPHFNFGTMSFWQLGHVENDTTLVLDVGVNNNCSINCSIETLSNSSLFVLYMHPHSTLIFPTMFSIASLDLA